MKDIIENGLQYPKISFDFEIDVSGAKTLLNEEELKKMNLPSNWKLAGSLACIDDNFPIFENKRYPDLEEKVFDWIRNVYSPSDEVSCDQIIERITKWVSTAVQCAVCMFPSQDPRSPQMWPFVLYTIGGYLIDDFFENAVENNAVQGVSATKEFRRIVLHDMRTPPYVQRDLTQHPLFKKFPILRTFYNLFVSMSKHISTIVENYEENGKYWLNEFEIWIESAEWQAVAHKQGKIVYKYVRGRNAGGFLTLEYLIMLGGAFASERIRTNIAFLHMNLSIGHITSLLNDVLGIAKDLNVDETVMSKVVFEWRESGLTFLEAFQIVIKETNDELRAGFAACQKLLAEFPDDPMAKKIVKTFVELADGHMMMFTACNCRYGDVRAVRNLTL